MNEELLALYSAIHFPSSGKGTVPQAKVAAFTAEISVFGYTIGGDVAERMKTLSNAEFDTLRSGLHAHLATVSGSTANHAVLFNRFPYSTPDDREYMERRVFGYMQNLFGMKDEGNYRALSCGHVVDPSIFDLEEFGACPICQHQVDELGSPERSVRFDFKSVTPLKVIGLASDEFVSGKVTDLIARNSSLSPAERKFIAVAGLDFKPDRPSAVFRETLPLVYKMFRDDPEYIATLVSGATDVLRIATFLSDENADLSLTENTKFKLSGSDKKRLLKILDGRQNLAEDLMRDRERWLRLGERLNPGSADNRKRYPNVATAFDALRTNPKSIDTFSRRMEAAVRARLIEPAVIETLSKRPGEFMRKIDFLLRTAEAKDAGLSGLLNKPVHENTNAVLHALSNAAEKAPTKLLLEIRKYLSSRNSSINGTRIFLPKGRVNRMQVREDRRQSISPTLIAKAHVRLGEELEGRFAHLEPMGKVYVDPALKGTILPFNRRGDSDTTTAVIKGARYPFNRQTDVLRFFIHWVGGGIDVDLSTVTMNADFSQNSQVAFTNLRSGGIIHSGDIQSAPDGASEFIDIDIEKVRETGARYILMSVLSYRGQTFDTFPVFAGYMERDAMKSGARYEPESVALKFEINAPVTNHMPLIFDLETREVVFADIVAGRNHAYGAVANKGTTLTDLAKAAFDLPNRKPTAHDVLVLNALARGTIVETPEEADVVYTVENLDIEEVLKLTAG